MRKIILAMIIGETSITIDDLVIVSDCIKAKEWSYGALNNTPCLLPYSISKVSNKQVSSFGTKHSSHVTKIFPFWHVWLTSVDDVKRV